MADAKAPPGSWRRTSIKEFTLLALFISLTVFLVHQTTLSRENAELPMDRVLAELEAHCPSTLPDGVAEASAGQLPPAFYGLAVWVDSPALLPGVHAALDLMKSRLAANGTTAEGDAASTLGLLLSSSPPPTHSLHSFVRVQSKARDAAVADLVAAARRSGTVKADRVSHKLEQLASQQQLGMPTLKHAFLPQVGQEVELHGLSLFSVPAEALPEGSKVQCFVADVRQAYCVLPVDIHATARVREETETEGRVGSDGVEDGSREAGKGAERTSSPQSAIEQDTSVEGVSRAAAITPETYKTQAGSLEAEVRAALLSVMTRQMGLRSVRAADVAAWKAERERRGCVYTIASVKSTLRSIEANTNMVIPLSTRHMFADLERHIASRAFVRAARAADDLQFHPSLTPQLYIPLDHSVVSQLVILLPVVSTTILALRLVADERRLVRKAAGMAVATMEKKEQ